jgi:hypothetical protein
MDGPAADPITLDALDALCWNWGEAYEIEITDGQWRALRRDGLGGWIEASNPEDLRSEIFADYSIRPVPRPPDESLTRHACRPADRSKVLPGCGVSHVHVHHTADL